MIESNPYYYKLPPGWWREVVMPMYDLTIQLLKKNLDGEKLTSEELKKLDDIQKKCDILKKGGTIGTEKKYLK